jgi:precorrin-2 methylase
MLLSLVFLLLAGLIQNADAQWGPKTQLYLVGMGTGDPHNITLRAINTIKDSDIIFCHKSMRDRFPILLQGKEIHDPGFCIFAVYGKPPEEAKKSKRFNYEEKMKEFEQINTIIRDAVKQGKVVSVLDSGDPTIYGPNMWYMEAFEDLNPELYFLLDKKKNHYII